MPLVPTATMEKKLLKHCTGMSDSTAEPLSPTRFAKLRSLSTMSTMSSFARSFSRLSTSLLECPDVDEEEEQEFELIVKATFLEYVPLDRGSLPRCQSDSALFQLDQTPYYMDPAEDSALPAAATDLRLPEGIPSVGSMLHETQQCRPCAWFWKPMGCANGSDCRHCHLCPAGELTRQRKVHRFMARQRRQDQGTACGAPQVSVVPVLLPVMPIVASPLHFCEAPGPARPQGASNPTLLGRI